MVLRLQATRGSVVTSGLCVGRGNVMARKRWSYQGRGWSRGVVVPGTGAVVDGGLGCAGALVVVP